MKTFIAILSFCLLLISSFSFAQDAKFHLAQTDAEKSLAHILQINIDKSHDLKRFIYGNSKRNKSLDKEFEKLFTDNLIKSYYRYYSDYPSEPDGSKYIDADNLTCSQDGPKTSSSEYKFQTIKQESGKEFILLSWHLVDKTTQSNKPISTLNHLYIMQKDNGGNWQLDGVQCFPDLKFNVE